MMRFKLLGTAAGGGFPQWNCHCPQCRGVRLGHTGLRARSQSSLAIAAAEDRWFLVNASPDIRAQLAEITTAAAAPRRSPIAGIILTDSQLDHASGLLLLRESGEPLPVYCTDPVYLDLSEAYPVLTMLGAYCGVTRRPLPLGREGLVLEELPGIRVNAVPLTGKAPPYSPRRGAESVGTNVALVWRDETTAKSVVYAPALAEIPPELEPYLAEATVILADGTCWHDDDLARAGCGTRLARTMGHLPLAGAGGLMAALSPYQNARRILVHINNTNPILAEDAAERRELNSHGIEVGYDGMELIL